MEQAEHADDPIVQAVEAPVAIRLFDSCVGVQRHVGPVYRVEFWVQINLFPSTSPDQSVVVNVVLSFGFQCSEGHVGPEVQRDLRGSL